MTHPHLSRDRPCALIHLHPPRRPDPSEGITHSPGHTFIRTVTLPGRLRPHFVYGKFQRSFPGTPTLNSPDSETEVKPENTFEILSHPSIVKSEVLI